ncbi:aminotransferase class V-fold PLP-dependent enzyme [Campylobacter portucalensis]|uniref:aminotransferase class V-fold PLP-dependent enzyme n=1 Tax=Campylobacter portucalensis TaxID=2608384 RepID=UPI002DD92B78|nr:aminotransferase class V-fold PLP-dependent enzyme [Campylobacter portucalensis]
MDLEQIKKNIILKQGVYYFDYTASSLAYKPIEDEILRILPTYSNTHSEASEHSRLTSEYYESARNILKDFLNLDDKFYLMPCGTGATAAIKKFQELIGIYIPPATRDFLNLDIKNLSNLPLVLVSPYEHHSNEISYRYGLCEVKRIGLMDGKIDFDDLNNILKQNKNRKIIASFSVASNITGVISDYMRLFLMVKSYGGIVALDGSSFISHDDIDSGFYDALFLSSHKLLGGVGGCGLLAIKKELCKSDEPTFASGGTVRYVSRVGEIFKIDKEKLEDGGTPGIIQLIKSFLAFKLRKDVGIKFIKERENMLKDYFLEKILKIDDINLYAKDVNCKLPIFSFNVKGFNPYDFSAILSQKYSVETRAGCSCAGPYAHDLMDIKDGISVEEKPGFVRISLHYTHSKDDIDYLISAIKAVVKQRGKIKFSQGSYLC